MLILDQAGDAMATTKKMDTFKTSLKKIYNKTQLLWVALVLASVVTQATQRHGEDPQYEIIRSKQLTQSASHSLTIWQSIWSSASPSHSMSSSLFASFRLHRIGWTSSNQAAMQLMPSWSWRQLSYKFPSFASLRPILGLRLFSLPGSIV